MQQTKWVERKFNFDSTENNFPSIMERLSGTPVRLEEKLSSIAPEILSVKPAGKWSVKEHIGHLSDLESLWQLRLQEITSNAKELTAADMANKKTDEANHNESSIDHLLQSFRTIRKQTMQMLEQIDEATVFKSAFHPRLKKPMRTLDLFLFAAEHDDHHLAIITALLKELKH